jgi:hypothetical protein
VVDSLLRCLRDDTHTLEQLPVEWWIPYPAAYETTPTPVSNCSWGGRFPTPLPIRRHPHPQATARGVVDPLPHCLRDDTPTCEQLLMGWWIPNPAAHLAPVIEGACHCGSSQMQELLVKDGYGCGKCGKCGVACACVGMAIYSYFETPLIFDDTFFLLYPHATQEF